MRWGLVFLDDWRPCQWDKHSERTSQSDLKASFLRVGVVRGQPWLTLRLTLRRPGPRWINLRTWRLWRRPKREGGVPGNGLNASARYRADSLESPTYSSLLTLCDQSVFYWLLHPTTSHPSTSSSSKYHLNQKIKHCRRVSGAEAMITDNLSYHFHLHRHYHVVAQRDYSMEPLLFRWNEVESCTRLKI